MGRCSSSSSGGGGGGGFVGGCWRRCGGCGVGGVFRRVYFAVWRGRADGRGPLAIVLPGKIFSVRSKVLPERAVVHGWVCSLSSFLGPGSSSSSSSVVAASTSCGNNAACTSRLLLLFGGCLLLSPLLLLLPPLLLLLLLPLLLLEVGCVLLIVRAPAPRWYASSVGLLLVVLPCRCAPVRVAPPATVHVPPLLHLLLRGARVYGGAGGQVRAPLAAVRHDGAGDFVDSALDALVPPRDGHGAGEGVGAGVRVGRQLHARA
mmetsp:Transcript_39108/g.77107  ORF Transcript_39108/g.77107 Transcript_39108/m.77107 type:complete len:261 (+) Transcript_39108:304-1086(+)